MAILLKIAWVDKSERAEPHLRIAHVGGASRKLQWKHSQAQAVDSIERGQFVYYVEKSARAFRVEVARTNDGQKYLAIPNNFAEAQLLLELPQFPQIDATSARL